MPNRRWQVIPFLGGNGEADHEKDIQHNRKHEEGERRIRRKQQENVDAGLDPQLSGAQRFAQKDEEDIVKDYNSPIHMWVVTTLFPLAAGTFGPMASMFNVCAIAISWRIVVDPSSKEAGGYHVPDPQWLVAVNAVSLAIAIIANISLLGQMTNRLRYNISGPITIVGFYISGLVDIGLVGAAYKYVPLPSSPHATYSQAFYYAAFSGAIYTILAMMLSVTAYGIWFRHYSNEFKLSMAQRSLMLQTILFLSYVLAAGGVYSVIEGWSYLDANYFVVVTLFTIGFGDFVPTTHLGRSLFFPFAVGGILFVGVIIANIRTLVLESGSVKVSTRLVEKARYKAIKMGDPNEGILRLRGVKRRDTNAPTELERREKEFQVMREIQLQAAHNNRLFALAFAIVAFVILWFIGAVAFWKAETESVGGQNWSYFETLYFTFVAQLTIGYGDFEPQTNSSKPTFVFWALIALPTLTVLIGAIGDVVSDFVNWYTNWIGSHTVSIANFFKTLFSPKHDVAEVKRAAKRLAREHQAHAQEYHPEHVDSGFGAIADLERNETVPKEFEMRGLTEMEAATAEEHFKPFIILKAAQQILSHLDASPPRKYNYEEWTWLLKLLGEDESDEAGHRRVGQPLAPGMEVVSPVRTEKNHVWSWLGQESPLMSLEEDSEPKWVLKRLMETLEKHLRERAERHVARDLGEERLSPGGSATVSSSSSKMEEKDGLSGTLDNCEAEQHLDEPKTKDKTKA